MIGIQAAPFSKEIHAGSLNSTRTMFTGSPQDVTDMTLRAVADFVAKHYGGGAKITFADIELDITVTAKETPV